MGCMLSTTRLFPSPITLCYGSCLSSYITAQCSRSLQLDSLCTLQQQSLQDTFGSQVSKRMALPVVVAEQALERRGCIPPMDMLAISIPWDLLSSSEWNEGLQEINYWALKVTWLETHDKWLISWHSTKAVQACYSYQTHMLDSPLRKLIRS